MLFVHLIYVLANYIAALCPASRSLPAFTKKVIKNLNNNRYSSCGLALDTFCKLKQS